MHTEQEMTTGIGINCDSGNTILLSCDKRGSYGNPSQLVSDSCVKLFETNASRFYVVIAGTVNECQMFEGYLAEYLKPLRGEISSLDAAKVAMLQARTRLHGVLADDQLRHELAISLEGFHNSSNLSPVLVRQARKIIRETDIPVEVIAGGIFPGGGGMLSFSGSGQIQETTTPGFHIIGTSASLARSWLCFRGQDMHMTAPRSYWHLREAIAFASMNPTVRRESVCIAIRKGGVFPVEKAQDYSDAMSKTYYPHMTGNLDSAESLSHFKRTFSVSENWG